MLKLATLSLAALLALASPAIAATTKAAPEAAQCIAPTKFPNSDRVEGADLAKLRGVSNLPEQVDLVLLLKTAPVAVAFAKGCAIGYGIIELVPRAKGETL